MLHNKTFLCLMLARGGSKGVPGKNIKPLMGRPLMAYTIEAVQQAGFFDRFILSTDAPEIAAVAESYGVEVPFLRPAELSGDHASALDAIVHALKWVEAHDKKYDYVQYIFPTAPLRTAEDIRNGAEWLLHKKGDMVLSVCETDQPLAWMNTLPPDKSLKNFVPKEFRDHNRQDLPLSYRINGSIYVAKWEVFYERRDWFDQNTYAYVMPRERSIDIDSPLDFKLAELMMKEQNND